MRALLTTLALLVVAVGMAVFVGVALYLGVSFVVMRRHTERRRWSAALRAFVAEAAAILWTQPLVPLFYFIGRRMGGTKDGRPIILVHGYFQNRADFVFLARALRRANLGPYGFNYDWTRSIAVSARRLGRFVEDVCRETGKAEVALVAHSLGGVIALEYVATDEGRARVARCVTIASPHAGVLWRGGGVGAAIRELGHESEYMRANVARKVGVPTLSIYSSHDNIVHPAKTSALALRGGEDELLTGVGHLGILFSREVASVLVRCLSS